MDWRQLSRDRKIEILNKLETLNRSSLEETICKVCQVHPITLVYVPCGHMCVCAECNKLLGNCPMCRARIEKSYTVAFGKKKKRAAHLKYDINEFMVKNKLL